MHPDKVICQKILQVNSIEDAKLYFAHYFYLQYNIFVSKFFTFFSTVRNQRQILSCLDTHIQIWRRKRFFCLLKRIKVTSSLGSAEMRKQSLYTRGGNIKFCADSVT